MDCLFQYVLLHRMELSLLDLSQRPYWLLPVGLGFGMLQIPVPNDWPLSMLAGPFLEQSQNALVVAPYSLDYISSGGSPDKQMFQNGVQKLGRWLG